jgi:hypothetical protein
MIHRLTHALCELAMLLLPARRQSWGEAMKAEVSYIGDAASALAHAGGCVIAAARERVTDFDSRFAAGLGLVALVGAAFGVFHIVCASRGVEVLFGARDGFLDSLVRAQRATPELVARYEDARPIVIACLMSLGLAHLWAAHFLIRRAWRNFLLTWCCALLIAIVAVVIQLSVVWSAGGLPSEFVALLIQAVALPLLLLWSNGRHRPDRSSQ